MAGTRVAVFFGGPSAEHAVSVRSADNLVEALVAAGFGVLLVHVRRDATWALEEADARAATGAATRLAAAGVAAGSEPDAAPDSVPGSVPGSGISVPVAEGVRRLLREADVAFPIIHGTLGEDGSLQGFLRVLGMPTVGPGVLASALSMDKARAKAVLAATTDLALPRSVVVTAHALRTDAAASLSGALALGLPCIVKPVDAGSSVGLTKVTAPQELRPAIERALAVEGVSGALIEEMVEGDEVTCAVVGDPETTLEALPPILIRPRSGGLFDYEAKYTPGASEELCPAPLPEPALERIRRAALTAYRALGCRGFARVDFILRDGLPWFLELNTLPGLTRESLLPKAARAAGYELPAFFRRLVEEALPPAERQARARGAS